MRQIVMEDETRLEAATSRLEDLAASTPLTSIGTEETKNIKEAPNTGSYVAPVAPPPPPSAPASMKQVPKSVIAYDENVIEGKLKPFLELTRSFAGPNVVEIVGLVEQEFKDLRDLLLTAAACSKPDEKGLESLLAPFESTIEAISRIKEANRKDTGWFSHVMVIGEGAPFVAWVLNPKPGPYLGEIKDQVLYYGNRIIKEFKEKDPKHAEWVRLFTALLDELRKYVVEHHTTGVSWNAKASIRSSLYSLNSEYTTSASAGDVPPPPPPPPPPASLPAPAGASAPAGGTTAVFAELNRGEEVTKHLRKVDKSEMTHKNPALRSSSTRAAAPKKPVRPVKPQALMGKKPVKFALEGKAWNIEHYEDDKSLIVDDTQLNQVVNIFGCKNTVIQVKGKINAVTLVNCTKTSVLIDSVVSSISVTKSPSFQIQITGTAPMIQIDSTDSGQIYLSKSSLDAEITTAKCSSINVSLPVEGEEEGVFAEQPVPEMLRTCVKDGKLVTTVVEHVG
uniref:Adenylyl cyclase-associated protein n=1 Tax=Moniliophthora roreri TaxID=221103 RepID=A0A0W0F912_MONRR